MCIIVSGDIHYIKAGGKYKGGPLENETPVDGSRDKLPLVIFSPISLTGKNTKLILN